MKDLLLLIAPKQKKHCVTKDRVPCGGWPKGRPSHCLFGGVAPLRRRSPLSLAALRACRLFCSPLRHVAGATCHLPPGGGKCKFVLRPKVCGKAKFFRAFPYHSPDLYPRADTWLPPRGHEQRPRPADETGSCEWRSALVFASARRGAPQKSAKRKRSCQERSD